MKSDHWNFLANLLGAPGAAEPPAQTPKTEPAKAAEPVKKDVQPASVPSSSTAASPEVTTPATRKSAFDSPSAFDSLAEPKRTPEPRTVDPLAFTSFRDLDDDEPVVATRPTQPPRQASSSSETPSSPNETSKTAEVTKSAESARSHSSSFAVRPEPVSAEDVLQALTAVTPPPRLPGFGVSSDPEPARDIAEPAKKETSMWGRIAGKFGVGGDRKSEREEEPSRPAPPKSEKPSDSPARSGFGGGLVDFDDDPEALPVKGSAARDVDPDSDDDSFGRPRSESGGRDSRRRGSSRSEGEASESTSRGPSSRGPASRDASPRDGHRDGDNRDRTRRTIARNEADDDGESIEVSPLEAPSRDEPAGRSSRRRGRRGIRQRMSEDDLDRPVPSSTERTSDSSNGGRSHEIRSEETNERDSGSRHAGSSRRDGSTREVSSSRESESSREKSSTHGDSSDGGRGRNRGRGRGRGRGGDSTQARDQAPRNEQTARSEQAPRSNRGPSRHRDDDIPAHDDAFVDDDDSPMEMDAEFDDIDDDGFGSGLANDIRSEARGENDKDDKDSDSARSPRSRSRRRGRRGRGRGTAETTPAAAVPADDFDDVDDLDIDDGIIEAKFDDDHEDDEQVEEIRRGSRRRPRSRRPARSENGDTVMEPSATSKELSARGTRDPKSRDADFGDIDSTDGEGSRRRSGSVPTWLETVELLVNANIENHNRSGNKSPRGGRGGSGNGGGNGNNGGRRR